MFLLIVSIPILFFGVTLLVIGLISNASIDREITSTEQLVETEKRKWVGEFAAHLKRIFSEPCPTCSTNTILAEGVETEVRSIETSVETFDDYLLMTTKSYTRYCPNCEKLLLEPAPMTELKTKNISQKRFFEGSESFNILQIHKDIGWIVDQFVEHNLDKHDQWGYQPGAKLLGYEELLETLYRKTARSSRFVVLGWVIIPIGAVLLFLGVFLK